jgi:alkylhydroperoxidase family enzyme
MRLPWAAPKHKRQNDRLRLIQPGLPAQLLETQKEVVMSRIPYVDPDTVDDAEIKGYLERARREGTPRPESQAIRANNPNVIRAFSQAWDLTFRNGVLEHKIKEMCRVYVSKSIDCEYWGVQRSVQGGRQGLTEAKYDELLNFETSDKFTEREKAALTYTSAIIWNADIADDALWEKLHRHFTNPELVELGFFVALTFGQQRWIKTLGIGHREILADNEVGLAPSRENT